MEGNRVCPICKAKDVEEFCICSNLPQFCTSCRYGHEKTSELHFALPISAWDRVRRNPVEWASWLVFVANSQAKLRENLPKIGKCRGEIETICDSLQAELGRIKAQLMQKVEELEGYFRYWIEEAVAETSNTCNGAYSPTTYLAYEVWTHACQRSSEPLSVFTYKSRPNVEFLRECMGISFENSIPGLEDFNYMIPTEITRLEVPLKGNEEGLKQEIGILRDKLETLQREILTKDQNIEDFKQKLSETEKNLTKEKEKTRKLTEKEDNL